MEAGVMFILFIFLALIIRIIAGSFDEDRVSRYIKNQGGELISKTWEPFGKGWAGEESDRIYQVRYSDRDGNLHEAYVKTSSMSGVYFTEDKIIEYYQSPQPTPKRTGELESLRAENAQLKKQLRDLMNA